MSNKQCKGTGKAKGHGCGCNLPYTEYNGLKTYKSKYGLGYKCGCFAQWLTSDNEEAKDFLSKSILKGKDIVQKEEKRKNLEMKKDFNSSKNMQLADMYFSRYIRLKHSINGKCTCYTCGKIVDIKDCDNGHFVKRQYKATRYHENNCRPQDKICNGDVKHNGKQLEFRENLIREIGLEAVELVEKLGRTNFQMTARDYYNKAEEYRIKLNELQKELGVKYW